MSAVFKQTKKKKEPQTNEQSKNSNKKLFLEWIV